MITARNVTRVYPLGKTEVHALRGVSLDIKSGEFVSIMGPSGSGKSTLLHQLGLLDTPTSGEITIDGVDILGLSDIEKIEFRLTQLGYVFQEYAVVLELTALENVCLPLLMTGRERSDCIRVAADLLTKVGLAERLNHYPSEMSGGEQQRVAIARALANSPKILFADEPCANLDSNTSHQILKLFRTLNRDLGQTIVMVVHEIDHGHHADRIIWLKDGLVEKETKRKANNQFGRS